mgnify:CR=1 FL=1
MPLKHSNASDYKPGARVKVPFGRTTKIGIILSTSIKTGLKATQLKSISRLVDREPLLTLKDISLYRWAAEYYHHPIGEVFAQSLPKKLRSDQHISLTKEKLYTLTATGKKLQDKDLKRSPRQALLWQLLNKAESSVQDIVFSELEWDWRTPLKSMVDKQWITVTEQLTQLYNQVSSPITPNNPLLMTYQTHRLFKHFC